ncbi:hypothetical protein ACJX0J_037432, partial [Zea mays]
HIVLQTEIPLNIPETENSQYEAQEHFHIDSNKDALIKKTVQLVQYMIAIGIKGQSLGHVLIAAQRKA